MGVVPMKKSNASSLKSKVMRAISPGARAVPRPQRVADKENLEIQMPHYLRSAADGDRPRSKTRCARHPKTLDLSRNDADERGREKRIGAKAAENRKGKRVTDNTPFSDRIPNRNSLRPSAFSASLRLFHPNSTTWIRLRLQALDRTS